MELVHGHKPVTAPQGVPDWDADPYAEAVLTDPLPFFAELRAKGPFAYLSRYRMLACGRDAVVRVVFGDHTRFVSSRGVGVSDFALEPPWRPPSIVLEVDPPAHARTRRVLTRALSPRAVADLREAFAAEAAALIDRLIAAGPIDAVADLAEAFPTSVLPRAVGLREPDPRRLIDYGAMVFNALGPDNDLRRRIMARAADIVPWINTACLRENLTETGFGATIYAAATAGDITEEEAGMLVRSLLSAGVDTTVTALGNAMACFAANPGQFAQLCADPSLALPAFEEVLRLTSPVHAFCRTAAMDCEVAGVRIEEGTKILCVLGAANTDPDRWPDPETFDITRRPGGHLALGIGVHMCVGQTIARAEGQAVLTALAERVRAIEPLGDPVWRPNNSIHALDSFPVRLVAR